MINVLVLEKETDKKSPLHEALASFDELNVVVINDYKEAAQVNKKQFFELIFFDTSCYMDQCSEVLSNNIQTIIIAFNGDSDRDEGKKLISLGIKDYLSKYTGVGLIEHRIRNYIEIIELKKQKLFNTQAVNLFDKKIYQRRVYFQLNSHSGIVEFWDYFMEKVNKTPAEYENLKDVTEVLYAFASWLFKIHNDSSIVVEYGHDSLFLTLYPVEKLSDKVVHNVITLHNKNISFIKNDEKLSIKLNREVTPTQIAAPKKELKSLDDEQKEILSKTHFNKITAQEFVSDTAVSFMEKVEIMSSIEDEIDERLISFEEKPSVESLNTVHEKFIEYVEIIKLLVEFDHLVFALLTLCNSMENVKEEQLESKEVKKFTTLMLHLLNDLSTWRENIFIKQEANDIHYLDSSLLSSCLQIQTIFEKKEIVEDDDDFELF